MKGAFVKYISSLLLFGLNGVVASFVLLDSYEKVFFRTMLGSLVLVAVFFISRKKLTFYKNHKKKKAFAFLCASGFCMGVSWMFLYEAYAQIGVSMSTLTYSCGPVIVMMLSPLIFKERLTAVKVFSFIAVFAGMILVNGTVFNGGSVWGFFCGIASSVGYSGMVIFNKKAKEIEGLENSALQLLISFVVVGAFIGIRQSFYIKVTAESIIPLLILGFINTGLGCYLYFSSIGKLKAQTVSIWGYLELLSAILFSFLFLHEALVWWQYIGAVLIIGGAAIGELLGNGVKKRRSEISEKNES